MRKSTLLALGLLAAAGCAVKTEKSAGTSAADTSGAVTTAPQTPSPQSPAPAEARPVPVDTSGLPRTPDMTVTESGIGPVRAGMTVAQAARALGGGFGAPQGYTGGCGYAVLVKAPPGLAVMLENGRVARVEVRSGTTPTSAGARIGDSEARIQSLYAGRVTSTPHKYTPGAHYLTVTPTDRSANRIVFETDGKVVTEFRSGALPAVEYVERCG